MVKDDLPDPEISTSSEEHADGDVDMTPTGLTSADPELVQAFLDAIKATEKKDAEQTKTITAMGEAIKWFKRSVAILLAAFLIAVGVLIYNSNTLHSINTNVAQTNARGSLTLPLILCTAKTSNAVAGDVHYIILKDNNIKHYPIPPGCKIPTAAEIAAATKNAK